MRRYKLYTTPVSVSINQCRSDLIVLLGLCWEFLNAFVFGKRPNLFLLALMRLRQLIYYSEKRSVTSEEVPIDASLIELSDNEDGDANEATSHLIVSDRYSSCSFNHFSYLTYRLH